MAAAVPPGSFYGAPARPFVPPVLRSAGTRRAVLASKRSNAADASRAPFRVFPTQAQAFAAADAAPHAARVWAVERDTSGRRRFLVAPTPALWRWYADMLRRAAPLHLYEVIRRGAACKAHFDLEFRRGEGGEAAEVDGDALTAEVVRVVGEVAKEWGSSGGIEDRVELLSSTPKKYSAHLVFPSILFRSNSEAGDFASEVESRLSNLARRLSFVDQAIFTSNRCFRLAGSAKFGRTQRLLPPHAYHSTRARPSCSERLFYAALVTNVPEDCTFLRVPVREVSFGDNILKRPALPVAAYPVQRHAISEWPKLDDYVRHLISARGGAIYTVTYFNGDAGSSVSYAIKGGWRYCARIQRHHKSNNIVLVASLPRREMHQRCFDPDCRDFRSEPWQIPQDVLPAPETTQSSPVECPEDAEFETELLSFFEKWEESQFGCAPICREDGTPQSTGGLSKISSEPVDFSGGISDSAMGNIARLVQ